MLRHRDKKALITEVNPLSPFAESYRSLRTHLQFASDQGPYRVLTCASAMPGEGKTTTLVNLAIAYAQEGKKTVIVDADMRRPIIHTIFDVPNRFGLSSLLRQSNDTEAAVKATNINNLFVLPSGPECDRPADLLAGERMESLIAILRETFDFILIDVPPVLAVADSTIIASMCDGVIMVVHARKSKRRQIKKAKEQMIRVRANLLGVVMNGRESYEHRSLYPYYYGRSPGF